MACIFAVSTISFGEGRYGTGTKTIRVINNILHIPAFGLLTLLWLKVFSARKVSTAALYTFIIIISYSALTELHQFFVPGRYPSIGDMALNTMGFFAGLGTYVYAGKREL